MPHDASMTSLPATTSGVGWIALTREGDALDTCSVSGDRRGTTSHVRLEDALCQTVRDRGLPLTQALPYDSQSRLRMQLLEGTQAAVQKSYRLVDPSRSTQATVTAHAFRDTTLRAIVARTSRSSRPTSAPTVRRNCRHRAVSGFRPRRFGHKTLGRDE